jgi:transposase
VCIKEMSVSEPPMTYRYNHRRCQNRGSPIALGGVCEVPDDCAGGNRYIGGMTLIQASPWNVGTCYFDDKGRYQVERSMSANTEARCRDGAVRSSVEASVMDVERSLSWLSQARRLRVRYERLVAMHQGFHYLQMTRICCKVLQRDFRNRL